MNFSALGCQSRKLIRQQTSTRRQRCQATTLFEQAITASTRDGALWRHRTTIEARAGQLAPIVVAIACAACVGSVVRSIPLHASLNYNEGWNAYHVMELIHGDRLYPIDPRFFFNNYPPLSFYVMAFWSRPLGDPIVAGRWLSLAAFIVWTGLLVPISVSLGARSHDARAAAAVFAANMLLFTEYVGIDDPQLLGHATAAVGLLLLVRHPTSTWRIVVCGTLFTTALFVKHSLIALPVACIVWLATIDRRAALVLSTAVAATLVIGALWSIWMFGPGFMRQLAAPRAFLVARAAGKSSMWALRLAAPLAITTVLARRFHDDPGVRFCAAYATIAAAIGVIFIGGDGVNSNVFFDAVWAMCVSSAIGLRHLPPTYRDAGSTRRHFHAGLLMAPLVGAVVLLVGPGQPAHGWGGTRGNAAAATHAVTMIASHPGPALCEELALCFWAGKSAEVDFFNWQQHTLQGSRGADELAQLLDQRYFSIVQLDVPGRPLGQEFVTALWRNYKIVDEDRDYRLLLPR